MAEFIDIISYIYQYVDMPLLREMIGTCKKDSTEYDMLITEFERRGELFVKWVNGLRIEKMMIRDAECEITYYSDTRGMQIHDDHVVIDGFILYRMDRESGTIIRTTWNEEGVMRSSQGYIGSITLAIGIRNDSLSPFGNQEYYRGEMVEHGLFERWDESGVKRSSSMWNNGDRHGLFERWDESGVKRSSSIWNNGHLCGKSSRWNMQGALTGTTVFTGLNEWTREQ